ncbi:hypothetical protein BJY01DRAFT_263531 [Aspergillus pseudoustus]|uniref:Gylcosyl hydrolase 115 C-terminal domain-containing protein n=1 Tax=Aspergillus pseudoustus TaxID=1810923 RepID=A0ABR4KW64_9EURO
MLDPAIVSFEPVPAGLSLAGLPVFVDRQDFRGVQIAAQNLVKDLKRASGQNSDLIVRDSAPDANAPLEAAILVGSIQNSHLLRDHITSEIFDTQSLEGKWESFTTAVITLPWARKCLVIAGSDKRGTIFGIYTLSEQLGISPWHWWADVPVKVQQHLYALPVTVHQGEPSVRYRGIFINDEAPSLTSWVHEKFGKKYNAEFYKTVFELLLRLKANFLWPAMWSGHPFPGSSFFTDDPRNQELADEYGIVVSTSHHEPMQRSTTEWLVKGNRRWAWDTSKEEIKTFFQEGAQRAKPYESYLTLGMRGAGDRKIEAENPRATLADVIQCQRDIIDSAYGSPDGERQLMALYKEVLEYYEAGLSIPDDVTLMFPDDNFGNLRRLPTKAERQRAGGAGVYYHLEYVGRPRGYKWINTNSCAKIYHQLRTAYDGGADTVWVINVGDIKPLELPISFVMGLAWNIRSFSASTIPIFFHEYSRWQFGDYAEPIAKLLLRHDRLLAIRKHEHLESDTLSIINYREADTILGRWNLLENDAVAVFEHLQDGYKGAFFQLVLHPIKASRVYTELRIAQAKNQLYGSQRRSSTNSWAQRTLRLFEEDFSLSQQYHNNPWTGDKWNHIMRQPHYGYSATEWQDPSRDLITGLCYVQTRQDSNPLAGNMGVAVEGHPGVRPGLINEETDRMQPSRNDLLAGLTLPPLSPHGPASRYFEIYSRSSSQFRWTVTASTNWVRLSQTFGEMGPDTEIDPRVEMSIDWTAVPVGYDEVIQIDIRSSLGDYEQVHLPVVNPAAALLPRVSHGFVECDGYVSIEPGSVPLSPQQKLHYEHHPFLGRLESGSIAVRRVTAPDNASPPPLTYDVYLLTATAVPTIRLYFTMALETDPHTPLLYSIIVDNRSWKEGGTRLLSGADSPGQLPRGWSQATMDGVWKRRHELPSLSVGAHSIGIMLHTTGLVLEKVVLDLGGVRASYLGPPASVFVPT